MEPKTLIQIQNEALRFFESNTFFDANVHLDKINLEGIESEDLKKGVLIAAMESLEKKGIVQRVDTMNSRAFILERPLNAHEQQVTIGYRTSVEISTLLNLMYEAIPEYKEAGFVCSPTVISEMDLQTLAFFASKYYRYLSEVASQDTEEEND